MQNLIESLGFRHAGAVHDDGARSRLSIKLIDDFKCAHEGWVYLWVKRSESDKNRFDICYVGKAGFTLSGRCDQHQGGFNGGSKKGMWNAERIRAHLEEAVGNTIHVYARQSHKCRVLNVDNVSLCEAEERAMLMMLEGKADLWNGRSKK